LTSEENGDRQRSRWRWRAYSVAKRAANVAGFDLTRKHFYSPIPGSLDDRVWGSRSPMYGVDMDLDRQLRWVEAITAPYRTEFQPPIPMTGDYTYRYRNGFFEAGDADVLFGMLRSTQPKRVVEFGSGHSTSVIQYALARNSIDGAPCVHEVYDPFAPDYLTKGLVPSKVHGLAAENVGDQVFRDLGAGDVLFVDTSHTVRIGGDVIRIVCEGLPLLSPGVVVHFHDIFLPYQYPRAWFEENENYWAEQYLLQAFLAFNDDFEVLAGLQALARDRPVELRSLLPALRADSRPSSCWLRRRPLDSQAENPE
jgi:hypothetical protein